PDAWFEDALGLLGGDPWTIVDHVDDDCAVVRAHGDLHRAHSVSTGVLEQRAEDALDQVAIHADARASARPVEPQRDAAPFADRGVARDRAVGGLAGIAGAA